MMNFANVSLFAVYSAMALYTMSFIFFTWDLAKRSSMAVPAAGGEPSAKRSPGTIYQRIGLSLLVVGWIFHLAATVLRGIAG
ncbi:MAG: hypothetical protein F2621_04685, partial [Actinobacteria bacterium]|nr:hypothetical protein [Actinomycetota bacterium]